MLKNPTAKDAGPGARATSSRTDSRAIFASPLLATVLAVAALCEVFVMARTLPARASKPDFSDYYVSALVLRHGSDPYTQDLRPTASRLGLDLGPMTSATYPPTFLMVLEPLTLLKPIVAYWVWVTTECAALAAIFWMLLAPDLPVATRVSLVALGLVFFPLRRHFVYAQLQIPILLIIVIAMRSLARGRDVTGGALLAFASLLKIYPALLGGYLLFRGRRRGLTSAIVVGVAGVLVTASIVGLDRTLSFRHATAIIESPYFMSLSPNAAINSVIPRLIGLLPLMPGPGRLFAQEVAKWGLWVAVLGATITVTLKSGNDDAVFATWSMAMILLAPTAWDHYLVICFLPFALIAAEANRGRLPRMSEALAMAGYLVAMVLPAIGLALLNVIDFDSLLGAAILNYPFPTAFLVWLAALVWAGSDERNRDARRELVQGSAARSDSP